MRSDLKASRGSWRGREHIHSLNVSYGSFAAEPVLVKASVCLLLAQ